MITLAGRPRSEGMATGSIVQHVETVEKFRIRFEQMWERCLNEEASLSAIEARYALLRADLHRYP